MNKLNVLDRAEPMARTKYYIDIIVKRGEAVILKNLSVKNFRNFRDVNVDLSNKNVFFGLNDIGKTNILFALRFLLDRDVRRNGFLESDFYQKDTKKTIEIMLTIDISNNDNDTKKLRAKMSGALHSGSTDVIIKLKCKFNKKSQYSEPELFWGDDINALEPIKTKGISYDVDYVFKIIYIDPSVDMYALFKKYTRDFLNSENEDDEKIKKKIETFVNKLNEQISGLSGVKNFQEKITPHYKALRDEKINIEVRSEMAIKGVYSEVTPYIKKEGDKKYYPTSGDGRRKLLAYSMFNLLMETQKELYIVIYLIEEPENHLHKSIQIALSKQFFQLNDYQYLFITTHSPLIVYEMDNVNLIRLYSKQKIVSDSYLYTVPKKYRAVKQTLNYNLAEAIFASKVLLVEGPSEKVLFNKILSINKPDYESAGCYILEVNGIDFSSYYQVLRELNIEIIIKTDNDIRKHKRSNKYSLIGISRCNKYVGSNKLTCTIDSLINDNEIETKSTFYLDNKETIDSWRNDHKVYLSTVDLENDLDSIIHNEMCRYLSTTTPVKYLQEKKLINMVELISKLSNEDCEKIFNSYEFACVKELV